MAGNSYGHHLRLSTFGESHGVAIGGVIDNFPAGVELDLDAVQLALDRRRPGQSALTTQRKESDTVEFLSGIYDGRSTGTPIGFIIRNEDAKSKDYSHLKEVYRPSHADFTYQEKYGHRDHRGGGRSSARETACRVVGGALAAQILPDVEIAAYVSAAGEISLEAGYENLDLNRRFDNDVRCPDEAVADQMAQHIKAVRKEGDTIGGIVTGVIRGLPVGLGAPVFDKLHADLAKAMMSINAVKGFEFGSGFASAKMRGSAHNDRFNPDGSTETNFSGGVQGGISNGMDIYFRVAFKPVATLMRDQSSINSEGEEVTVKGKGRHDACVVPRAVPIVEAMAALTVADHFLLNRSSRI
ncbi:chorismate synthase [Cryomorphaceae bacterium]|nr:chorismate synthase [Cryomorphaceae bacterium]